MIPWQVGGNFRNGASLFRQTFAKYAPKSPLTCNGIASCNRRTRRTNRPIHSTSSPLKCHAYDICVSDPVAQDSTGCRVQGPSSHNRYYVTTKLGRSVVTAIRRASMRFSRWRCCDTATLLVITIHGLKLEPWTCNSNIALEEAYSTSFTQHAIWTPHQRTGRLRTQVVLIHWKNRYVA